MKLEDFEKSLISGKPSLLDKIGAEVQKKAKHLCPVDTGHLRSKIEFKVIPSELSVVIGTNVEYAKYVEFMAPLEAPRPGRECGQMPFLRPAIFQSKRRIRELIKKHFSGR